MGERGVGKTTSMYGGPDAYSTQRDAWAQRLRERPRQVWVCSTKHAGIWEGELTTSGAPVANTWYFLPLCPLGGDLTVHEMRMRITTLAGGADIDVALYRYVVHEDHAHLHMVPGTYAEFSATTTGVKSVTFPHVGIRGDPQNHATLRPEATYFIGYASSSTTTRFAAVATSGGLLPVVGMRELPLAGHRRVSVVEFGSLAESSATVFPFIVFLSERGSEIF